MKNDFETVETINELVSEKDDWVVTEGVSTDLDTLPDDGSTTLFSIENAKKLMEEKDYRLRVLKDDIGTVISFVLFSPQNTDTGVSKIANIWTSPDYRGNGLGKDLLTAAIRGVPSDVIEMDIIGPVTKIAKELGFVKIEDPQYIDGYRLIKK